MVSNKSLLVVHDLSFLSHFLTYLTILYIKLKLDISSTNGMTVLGIQIHLEKGDLS